jgi:hypothetical protein
LLISQIQRKHGGFLFKQGILIKSGSRRRSSLWPQKILRTLKEAHAAALVSMRTDPRGKDGLINAFS